MFIINFCLNMFRASLCPSSEEQRPCYCIRCTALILLDVVGSGCGALRCRMRAVLASYLAFCSHILHEICKRKANWIGHILRRNCFLQRVIEGEIKGRIEMTGRQGRRRGKLLDDSKDRRGYCHLKEEGLDRTMWRARFGRSFGPVVRQTIK
jgi:hypothetical protein